VKIVLAPMLLNWKEFATGCPDIDQQHRDIIELINELYTARFSGDREMIKGILTALIQPTLNHFAHEELLMERIYYPDAEAHIIEHEKLKSDSLEYIKRFDDGEDIAAELQAFLFDWLVLHIRCSDRKIIDFYQSTLHS